MRPMYGITLAEHPDFRIPYFGFRWHTCRCRHPEGNRHRRAGPSSTPGLVGKGGVGQIGAGILRPPMTLLYRGTRRLVRQIRQGQYHRVRRRWLDKIGKVCGSGKQTVYR